jgi:hypothetical protein
MNRGTGLGLTKPLASISFAPHRLPLTSCVGHIYAWIYTEGASGPDGRPGLTREESPNSAEQCAG